MATKVNFLFVIVGVVMLIFLMLPNEHYINKNGNSGTRLDQRMIDKLHSMGRNLRITHQYQVAIISDLDQQSKDADKPNTWRSYLRYGQLKIYNDNTIKIIWNKDYSIIQSQLAEKGRGMELSELILFNNYLCALDDRSGVIFKIINSKAVPWVILADGDGTVAKGFKSEWATIKDDHLIVGGFGKEWTSKTGQVLNVNPQFIKRINKDGGIQHVNWVKKYEKVKSSLGIKSPGYVIHEAIIWSNIHRKWFFLPRRISHQKYDDVKDETRGTNVFISCNEHFDQCNVKRIGILDPVLGYSAMRFIPDTRDKWIVALKTKESKGKVATFITVFSINGTVLMPDQYVDNKKFEGIEFIP